MHNFRELIIWQESRALAKEVFMMTKTFPSDEKFGLASQINRAFVSVPSNITKGTSESSDKAFNQFLEIDLGSLFELKTQLIIAKEFNYINQSQLDTISGKL